MMKKTENRNVLDFSEILDFFMNSWISGFKILGKCLINDQSTIFLILNSRIGIQKHKDTFIKPTDYVGNSVRKCNKNVSYRGSERSPNYQQQPNLI